MDKRRKLHSYQYNTKKPKQNFLDIGMKGYLCSCNFREKDCIRESYNILNKYVDLLYPDKTEDKIDDNEQNEDVLDDLADEINQLKSDNATPATRRFNSVQTGVKNIVFISTTLENPVELAIKIVEDINQNKSQQTRYLIRLIPVEVVCKASLTNILDGFKPLVEKHFKGEATTFSIAFNHRYNNNVPKDEVIKSLADLVTKANTDHKVNLTQPKLTVIVEIIKGLALLSVTPDYLKYKKYNLLSATEENKDKTDQKVSGGYIKDKQEENSKISMESIIEKGGTSEESPKDSKDSNSISSEVPNSL